MELHHSDPQQCYVGLTLFTKDSCMFSSSGTFCGMLSVPHNSIMDMNNVMLHLQLRALIFYGTKLQM